MQRITITLPDELAEGLRRKARTCHKSLSEVVREALVEHESEAALSPLATSWIGMGESDGRHPARDIDADLAENWPSAIMRHRD